jgi:hypothetical protein
MHLERNYTEADETFIRAITPPEEDRHLFTSGHGIALSIGECDLPRAVQSTGELTINQAGMIGRCDRDIAGYGWEPRLPATPAPPIFPSQ